MESSGYTFEGFIEILIGLYYCEKDGTPWSNRAKGCNQFKKQYLNELKKLTTIDNDGYYIVNDQLQNKKWHRVIYEHFNGKIPEGNEVDHLDNNPSNNLIENLRLLDHKNNIRKRLKHKCNNTGFAGVFINKKSLKYKSQIKNNGNIIWLGTFDDPQEAFVCYLENKIYYHGWDSILPLI